jgi:tight adherence protein B
MALIFVGFFSILMLTFGVIVVMTRRPANEELIAPRMAAIRNEAAVVDGAPVQTSQFFKTTRKVGWLDTALEPYAFAQKLQLKIIQANSTTTIGKLMATSLGLSLTGYCATWLFTQILLVDLGVAFLLSLAPFGFLSFKRSRRINAFNTVLPEAIDMLGRALRAGHSVVSGLEMLGENTQEPAAFEFGEISEQMSLGLPMRDALLALLERVPSPDLRVLVTAILVQKETGGNLVEILDRTVFVIRERLRIQGEIQVQTAQGRLTGWILSALPVVMMVVLNLVNPGYSSILFSDPFGRKLIYVSLSMLFVGSMIIRKIVNGIEV